MVDYENRAFYTVRRGHQVRHGDEYFYPGMMIARDHPCVPANRSKLVTAILPDKPKPPADLAYVEEEDDDE
jgi:hypothetical protein